VPDLDHTPFSPIRRSQWTGPALLAPRAMGRNPSNRHSKKGRRKAGLSSGIRDIPGSHLAVDERLPGHRQRRGEQGAPVRMCSRSRWRRLGAALRDHGDIHGHAKIIASRADKTAPYRNCLADIAGDGNAYQIAAVDRPIRRVV
jgi:hypothetical protein